MALPRATNPNSGARADPAPPLGWDETREDEDGEYDDEGSDDNDMDADDERAHVLEAAVYRVETAPALHLLPMRAGLLASSLTHSSSEGMRASRTPDPLPRLSRRQSPPISSHRHGHQGLNRPSSIHHPGPQQHRKRPGGTDTRQRHAERVVESSAGQIAIFSTDIDYK